MSKINNPIKIILVWSGIVLLGGITIAIIADRNAAGGEQKLLTYFANTIIIWLIGTALLAISTPFIFISWSKKFWYLPLAVLFLCIITLLPSIKGLLSSGYYTVEETVEVSNEKIDVRKEYYDDSTTRLRSESYWRNGKKDSTWIVYAKNGIVLSHKTYKNGILNK